MTDFINKEIGFVYNVETIDNDGNGITIQKEIIDKYTDENGNLHIISKKVTQ